MRPFFTTQGGKQRLLDEILPRIPERDVYFEPFLGSGAVLLALKPPKARVNDSNQELINAWRVVKSNVVDVISLLETHQAANCKEYYYSVREWDRNGRLKNLSPVERGARFIYLARNCFQGLIRYNRKGQFNAAFLHKSHRGNSLKDDYVSNLREVSQYLNEADVIIENKNVFDFLCQPIRQNDFVYFDPPYCYGSDEVRNALYLPPFFEDFEHCRLTAYLYALDCRGVRFLLSNSATDTTRKLYKDFSFNEIEVCRVGKKLISTQTMKELLISPRLRE